MNQKDCVTPPKKISGLHYTIKQFLPVAVSQVHRDDVLELNWRIRTHCYPLVLRLEKEKINFITIVLQTLQIPLKLTAWLNDESWELGQGLDNARANNMNWVLTLFISFLQNILESQTKRKPEEISAA